MKRNATESHLASGRKRQKIPLPDYCDLSPQRDHNGSDIWPAAPDAIENARNFLKEWYVPTNLSRTNSLVDTDVLVF